jgi:hypothetical protein
MPKEKLYQSDAKYQNREKKNIPLILTEDSAHAMIVVQTDNIQSNTISCHPLLPFMNQSRRFSYRVAQRALVDPVQVVQQTATLCE